MISTTTAVKDGFHFTQLSGKCHCPIHRGGEPFTAPLGLRFADHVHVEPVDRHMAEAIYRAHHSYMSDIPRVNVTHHGLLYQNQLVGAITWRYPLLRSLEYNGTQYRGDEIIEAARICIGVEMANLGSAALARSMERFIRQQARRRGIRLLLTFVRADFEGSMVKALRDKGWHCTGKTEPGQAGNRPEKEIRDHPKWRFLCELPSISTTNQVTFDQY